MKLTYSAEDQKIIELLGNLQSINVDYPPELLARRRVALIKQITKWEKISAGKLPSSQDQGVVRQLKSLAAVKIEYPPELLARRRVALMKQITKREKIGAGKFSSLRDQDIIRQLKSLAAVKIEYPPELMARRRSVFAGQIVRRGLVSWWEAFLFNIQSKLNYLSKISRPPLMEVMRTSLVIGGIIVAAYLGFSINRNSGGGVGVASNISPTGIDVSKHLSVTATTTLEFAETICKLGYVPPLCLAKRAENTEALSYQGNGFARAAVAKDTLPGFDGIHQPSNVNDGVYGSGASWISETAYSWVKIDLGRTMPINTISFGKDRLSNIDGRDPGQFTVAVASYDNVYADGDSSNDINEYRPVYNSSTRGFTGVVSGSETVQVAFEPVLARYVKITVTNPGTAIDEVEVFFVTPPPPSSDDQIAKTKEPPAPRATWTLTFTNTPSRTPTNTPSRTPTNTPSRTSTNTSTPIPTNTSTNTSTPIPTNTSSPTSTATPAPTSTPLPTNTSTPVPTSTPLSTSTPLPTNTLPPLVIP